jgi:Na+/H+ antiporter NhaD/arsenite permease-like protein
MADPDRTTGGHRPDRGWLSATASTASRLGRGRLIMVAAMAVTPFLNNAATVLVMAPIAATSSRPPASATGPKPS